jgi:hypothetical protein
MSLLVLAEASPLTGLSVLSFASEGLWFAASAGLVGVCSCDISCSCGVVELSDCGVVLVLGVVLLGLALLSGVVVVVVVDFVVVLLAPGASVAGFAHGASGD